MKEYSPQLQYSGLHKKIALEFIFNLCPFEDSNGLTPINYVEKATSR